MMVATGLSAAEPSAATVLAGRVGSLGDWQVGVGGVYIEPLRAALVFWQSAPGSGWESSQTVMPDHVIFANSALYRVQMAPGSDGGNVSFAPIAAATPPLPPGSVILATDGSLRVDGPDTAVATDIRVVKWVPDDKNPRAVEVEIWPAKWGRTSTKPEDFKHIELTPGGHARFGHTDATVVSLQGASADHPGWVVLHLSKE